MKVIFTDNVPGVAIRGDVKNVKDGFFRNYLLPRRKALIATESLLQEWEKRKQKMLIEKEQLNLKLEEIKRRLAGTKLIIEKKVTTKGTLYGGVKSSDVVKALKEQLSIEIPVTAVLLEIPIKTVGVYDIRLNLGEGIDTSISVEVKQK